MADEWTDEGAVLVVRVWSEPQHHEDVFRARVVTIMTPGSSPVSAAVASPAAVLTLVEAFLDEYRRSV